MEFREVRERMRLAGANRAQQVLRLVAKLRQIWNDGKAASGHDEPP